MPSSEGPGTQVRGHRRDGVTPQDDADDETLRQIEVELVDSAGGVWPDHPWANDEAKAVVERLQKRRATIVGERERLIDLTDANPKDPNIPVIRSWIDNAVRGLKDRIDALKEATIRARNKRTGSYSPTLDPQKGTQNFTPSGNPGRERLTDNPYGKGETYSSDGYSSRGSASPFTAGNDTSGAGNPYAVGGTPGYGDQQPGTRGQASYGGSVQAGAAAPGYDDEQVNDYGSDTQADEEQAAETDDTQSEREKQSGSGPDPEGNQDDAGTPTYEGNEKGWVSAQALNRVFQLIGGGNGARGTPGGIRNDARKPGPSISGFSGVSNPLAPYIRTTGEEGTRRFGGPRGGKRGVDPRNIRSDGPGYGGNEQATDRYINLSGLGPIAPEPNVRNPFETSGSVVSKNRR